MATSPANRTRTRIGVGEEVELTTNKGPATWTVSGSGTLTPETGTHTTVTYTAAETAGSVTITAAGSCTCSITLTVVEPSGWTMTQAPGTGIKHTHNKPDCGWKARIFVVPADVNFEEIDQRELDSQAVAPSPPTPNSFAGHAGTWHGSYPLPDRASPWIPMIDHIGGSGTRLNGIDQIYTGYPASGVVGTSPPFVPGHYYWPITMEWKLDSSTPEQFNVQNQDLEIFATGRAEARKGGNTEHAMWNDPTSSW